jgi:hypothetical protein
MKMKAEQKPLNSSFGSTSTAIEVIKGRDLRGKTAIVTGGHSGAGLETSKVLVSAGAAPTRGDSVRPTEASSCYRTIGLISV